MARPSIPTANSYWLLISHISLLQPWKNIAGFQRWTLSYSLTLSAKTLFPPTQACELENSLKHTYTQARGGGGSSTADYGRHGLKLLFSPVLSLTVFLPNSFPLSRGLIYTREK